MLFPICCRRDPAANYPRESHPPALATRERSSLVVLALILPLMILSGCVRSAEYSAYTQSLLHRIDEIRAQRGGLRLSDEERKEMRTDERNAVRGTIQVEGEVDTLQLNILGIVIHSRIGDIWTASIPLDKLRTLGRVRGVRYIEITPPARPRSRPAVP